MINEILHTYQAAYPDSQATEAAIVLGAIASSQLQIDRATASLDSTFNHMAVGYYEDTVDGYNATVGKNAEAQSTIAEVEAWTPPRGYEHLQTDAIARLQSAIVSVDVPVQLSDSEYKTRFVAGLTSKKTLQEAELATIRNNDPVLNAVLLSLGA